VNGQGGTCLGETISREECPDAEVWHTVSRGVLLVMYSERWAAVDPVGIIDDSRVSRCARRDSSLLS